MVLVTGAGGKTGLALLRELGRRGRPSRALVRTEAKTPSVLEAGASEVYCGDLLDRRSMERAFDGISTVYHIPPNIHEEEVTIGENLLQLALERKVEHFVYHSVLHPYVHAMPHHLKKAQVEERIFASGLSFTILQPEAYMQNYLPGLDRARSEGVFPVPYPADSRLGLVHLEDVACAAASVIGDAQYFQATYEISSGQCWTPHQMAEAMSAVLKRPVQVLEISHEAWEAGAQEANMSRYQIETLQKMFVYYARNGFWGNSVVLERLLGRPPKTFNEFLLEQEPAHPDA